MLLTAEASPPKVLWPPTVRGFWHFLIALQLSSWQCGFRHAFVYFTLSISRHTHGQSRYRSGHYSYGTLHGETAVSWMEYEE